MIHLLFVGDVVGHPGIEAAGYEVQRLKRERPIDLVVMNGENADNGFGLTERSYHALKEAGADVITLGNHAWDKKEIFRFIDSAEDLVRPANYPRQTPGQGRAVVQAQGYPVAVVQLLGRTFLNIGDCPFAAVDRELKDLAGSAMVVVDIHAEATADKLAMAFYLDGRVTAVLGTHTHVQTADEQIFPAGTGYISDIGMTGPSRSVLGIRPELSLRRIRDQLPVRFAVAEGPTVFCAVWLAIDPETGLTQQIERIQIHRN